eukprot:gene24397-30741_t
MQSGVLSTQSDILLTLLEPLPVVTKFDSSISSFQRALYVDGLRSNVSSTTRRGSHPVLTQLVNGVTSIGLSVMFRRDSSLLEQQRAYAHWQERLLSSDVSLCDQAMGSIFWTTAPEDVTLRAQRMPYLAGMRADIPSRSHRRTTDRNSHPNLQTSSGDAEAVHSEQHGRWSAWHRNIRRRIQQSGEAIASDCGFDQLKVTHRRNSLFVELPSVLLPSLGEEGTVDSSACFALLVSTIATDLLVTRLALVPQMHTLNNNARVTVQSGASGGVESYSLVGLNGTGEVIGVSDTGIDENHCFFRDDTLGKVPRSGVESTVIDHRFRKVVQYVNFSSSGGDYAGGHGTHVAGSLAGHCSSDGDAQNLYGGMAPEAKIAFFDIGTNSGELVLPYELADFLYPPAYKASARIHSNSWGGGYFYDGYCIETDRYLYEHDDFVVLFAAGNDGGAFETIVSPSLSKNAISVGCSENSHEVGSDSVNNVASFSSIGPTHDGRFKPEIVAPGVRINSALAADETATADTCSVAPKSGTSMATPVAAGNAALIRQYFQDPRFWAARCDSSYQLCRDGAFAPSGYLLKSLILHSGSAMSFYNARYSAVGLVELGQTPDSFQGYGRLDLSNILPLSSSEQSAFDLFLDQSALSELTELTYAVTVASSSVALKVTISWFDPPNEVFAAKVLQHDLDLVVVTPDGTILYGNGHNADGTAPAGSRRDEVNNNEQVLVTAPAMGDWTVRVQAKGLFHAAQQKFAIVITSGGHVVPSDLPAAISPLLLGSCQSDGDSQSSQPRLEVELSLWSRVGLDGWVASDVYTITDLSSSAVVLTGSFEAEYSYEVETVCMLPGNYSAALSLSDQSTPGTQMSIAECGVYLAPLAPTQTFRIDSPVSVGNLTVLAFAEDACSASCWHGDHFVLDVLLSEQEGAGWTGTYYAIIQLPSDDSTASFATQGVAAGSMEWGFDETQSQCLPSSAESCFALQMSIAANTEEFPQLILLNAFTDALKTSACPHVMNAATTLARFCTSDSGGDFVNATFYSQSAAFQNGFGQTPVSWGVFADSQRADSITEIGQCVLYVPLVSTASKSMPTAQPTPSSSSLQVPTSRPSLAEERVEGGENTIDDDFDVRPVNATDDAAVQTSLPSVAPTQLPTGPPVQTPTVSPSESRAVMFDQHSYFCFSDCMGFVGVGRFGLYLNETCSFLSSIYDQCDSYSVAYGLCPIVQCAADCQIADWCYFASGWLTACPYETWQGDTLAAVEIATQCTASVTESQKQSASDNSADSQSDQGLSATARNLIIGTVVFFTILILFAIYQLFKRSSTSQAYSLTGIDSSTHSGMGMSISKGGRSLSNAALLEEPPSPPPKGPRSSLLARSSGSFILNKIRDKTGKMTRGSSIYEMVPGSKKKPLSSAPPASSSGKDATFSPFSIVSEDDDEDEDLGGGPNGGHELSLHGGGDLDKLF